MLQERSEHVFPLKLLRLEAPVDHISGKSKLRQLQ